MTPEKPNPDSQIKKNILFQVILHQPTSDVRPRSVPIPSALIWSSYSITALQELIFMALSGKGVLCQIICQVQFQETGRLHREELTRAVPRLCQSRLGCALLPCWVSSLTYLALAVTQHIWPRLWQDEMPISLGEGQSSKTEGECA